MNQISNTAKLWRDTRITNSQINDDCSIGDDSVLVDAILSNYVAIGRRNLIRDTQIGYGSYTNSNTTINHCEIGKFCCISSNVGIYGGGSHDYQHVATFSAYHYQRVFGTNGENQRGEPTGRTNGENQRGEPTGRTIEPLSVMMSGSDPMRLF